MASFSELIPEFKNLTNAIAGNSEETGKTAAATIMLVNALNSTLTAQSTLAQSFVSTGRSMDNIATTVDFAGMNLLQGAKLMAEVNSEGVRMGREQVASNLSIMGLLGKNTKAMASLTAFNEQSLGATGAQNANLIQSITELAANFNVDSDKLVAAMQKLGNTLISAAATYGQESSLAIQQATAQLVAELGTGADGLINSVMSKIAAGTAEAGKLAQVLGVDTAAFRGTDPAQIVNTVKEMMSAASARLGGFRGGDMAEFVVDPLMRALGIDSSFLVLGDALQNGFAQAAGLTQEQLKEQIIQADINKSIGEAQKAFQKALLPFVRNAAAALESLTTAMSSSLFPLITGIVTALGVVIALLGATLVVSKAIALITAAGSAAQTIALLSIGGLAIGIGAVAGFAAATAQETTTIAEESKQQTQLMKDSQDKGNDLLASINSNMALLNAINEQQLSELETSNQNAPMSVDLNMGGGGGHQTLDPSLSVLRRDM